MTNPYPRLHNSSASSSKPSAPRQRQEQRRAVSVSDSTQQNTGGAMSIDSPQRGRIMRLCSMITTRGGGSELDMPNLAQGRPSDAIVDNFGSRVAKSIMPRSTGLEIGARDGGR